MVPTVNFQLLPPLTSRISTYVVVDYRMSNYCSVFPSRHMPANQGIASFLLLTVVAVGGGAVRPTQVARCIKAHQKKPLSCRGWQKKLNKQESKLNPAAQESKQASSVFANRSVPLAQDFVCTVCFVCALSSMLAKIKVCSFSKKILQLPHLSTSKLSY